ncbi:MAG: hypothetical protein QM530_09730 [Phycisphaerales bacterium]|nr:hypothetical protein [Phycisphaerales bacterium]
MQNKQIGLLRADSGFYAQKIFTLLETQAQPKLTLPPAEVWRLYRGRAICENQIKELKYDYATGKINQQSFDATEATLNFIPKSSLEP